MQVLGARTSDEDYSQVLPSLKRPHLDYLRDFYADTAMFGGGAHALRCGLDFFGSDRVIFATDTPLGPIAPTIEAIDRLQLRRGAPQAVRRQCRAAAEAEANSAVLFLLHVGGVGRADSAGGERRRIAGWKALVNRDIDFVAVSFSSPLALLLGLFPNRLVIGVLVHRALHYVKRKRAAAIPVPGLKAQQNQRSCLIQASCTSSHQLPTFHWPQAPRPPSSSGPE